MKHCSRCDALKDEGGFSKDSRKRDGRRSYCKECERASKARQRTVNRDSICTSNAKYWRANKKVINRKRRIIYKLKPLAGNMPAWKIGETLYKSTSWINEMAQYVGISLAYSKARWSMSDVEKLMRLRSQGVTKKKCAAILNRSMESIKAKLNEVM